jgi:hypothetical protein
MPQGRTAAKLIRFAPDELAAVNRRARTCGRTPARFIREAALGAIPKARPAFRVAKDTDGTPSGARLQMLAECAAAGVEGLGWLEE